MSAHPTQGDRADPWTQRRGRRLRVCLVAPGFSTHETDGCVPAMREFALRLGSLHDVTVVSLRFPYTTVPYELRSSAGCVRVLPLGAAATTGVARLGLLARAVQTVVQAGPFDVVQGLWADEPGVVAALAGRTLGAQVIVSFMGGERAQLGAIGYGGQMERLGPQLVATAVKLAHQITVGSPWYLDRLPAIWRAKCSVLPLALTPTAWVDRRAAPQPARRTTKGADGTSDKPPLRVGFVASLSPVKAPGLLLSAAALAQRDGAALEVTIIGDGPLRYRLERQAQRLRVPATFVGQVPFPALNEHLRNLDVVVQTSWWESQGMAILEAAATGCAVMGTRVGALAHLDSALARTEPGQVPPLAATLYRAATEPGWVFSRGREAATEVMVDHDPGRCLNRWHALL